MSILTKKLLASGGDSGAVEGWDISTAIYKPEIPWELNSGIQNGGTYSLDVSSLDSLPYNIFIKPDGSKLYFVGDTNDSIFEYDLETPWELDSAVFSQSFDISTYEVTPRGLSFKSDGSEMYVTGIGQKKLITFSLSVSWDISTAEYAPKITWRLDSAIQNGGTYSLSVLSEDTLPYNIFIKPDGSKLFFVGTENKSVYEYTLSTPWQIATATFVRSFDVSLYDLSPEGLFFKTDGTELYIIGAENKLLTFSLSTAWDISTATYAPKILWNLDSTIKNNGSYSLDISALEGNVANIYLKPDGTKLYFIGYDSDSVHEYTLSTPWEITTATFVQSFDVSIYDGTMKGLSFKTDGTEMYVIGNSGGKLFTFSLSTPWNISSATYAPKINWDIASSTLTGTFSISSQETQPGGMFFKPDGSKVYVVGYTSDSVHEYDLSVAWDITSASLLQSFSVASLEVTPMAIFFKDDGSKMYIGGASADRIVEYDLSTSWDISTATYNSAFLSVSAQESSMSGMFFKEGGSVLYIIGYGTDTIYEYSLSTAWDISTATYTSNSLDISAYELAPYGLTFKPDGSRLYVVGQSTGGVDEFELSTAWDITSATYTGSFAVGGSRDVAFKSDGSIMYVVTTGDIINQYTLGAFVLSGTDSSPNGLFFKQDDGTKMYVVGSEFDNVYEYTMSTGWDITTLSYTRSFSVAAQEAQPSHLHFKPDGTKMFVTGFSTSSVYEYDLSTPWNISTSTLARSTFTGAGSGTGIFFKPDGSVMYISDYTSETIEQWDLGGFDLTQDIGDPRGLFFKQDDGTKLYLLDGNSDEVAEYDLGTGWDITTLTYTRSFSIAAQEINPYCVFFRSDGLRMYISGRSSASVHEYNLSTAWNISTAVFIRSLYTNTESGLFFKPDGTVMYATDYTTDSIEQWDLGSFNLSGRDDSPNGIFFKQDDGTKMYMIGAEFDNVYEYTMSTGWDITTLTYTRSFSIAAQEINPHSLFFKPDGSKMYISGFSSSSVHEYDLSTPWNISTAVFIQSLNTSTEGGLFFKPDGTVMYATDHTTDSIEQWDLGGFDISQQAVPSGVFFRSDGTKMYVSDSSDNDSIFEYDLSTGWDMSSASYLRSLSVTTEAANPSDVFFKPDGSKMYVADTPTRGIYEYDLSTSWNVSTAIYSQNFILSGFSLDGISFNSDGTKMYALRSSSDLIEEYDLGVAWDISTAFLFQSFNILSIEGDAKSIYIRDGGEKYFVAGLTGLVHEYNMTTPWDISSSVFQQTLDISTYEASPQGLFFKPDGTLMFVTGTDEDKIITFSIATQ